MIPKSQRKPLGKCHSCANTNDTKGANCSSCAEKARVRTRASNHALKLGALEIYGEQCTCAGCSWHEGPCQVDDINVLAIDHINGGGNKHRAELGNKATGHKFYQWLKSQQYPPGYQTHCLNCNWTKFKTSMAHKDKQKPIVLPALKRRSIIALHAKRRHAGPMKDKRDRSCPTCRDTGVVELRVAPGINRKFACYDCQHD